MSRAALPRTGDYVWFSRMWPWPVVYHARADRDDRKWEQDGHEGVVAGWAFTRCGLRIYSLIWNDESEQAGRFWVGREMGSDLPFRLLNPAQVRPCHNCYGGAL